MLSVEEAIEKLTSLLKQVEQTEGVALEDAVGRVLSEGVRSRIDVPPFDSSAMDGYAVIAGDRPLRQVIGESKAGRPFDRVVSSGQAVRVLTGAAIPEGANTVVVQEDIEPVEGKIEVCVKESLGDNIRIAGNDVRAGSLLAHKGDRVDPILGSWFMACGVTALRVYRQVRVGVFSTGDELQDSYYPLGPGQIYDSNRFALISLATEPAVSVLNLGRLPDDRLCIEEALRTGSHYCDLLITTGGVSVGDADQVRPAIENVGTLEFWKIALKPGKPLAIARVEDSILFGLPGNPISSIITYMLFVAPAIRALSGSEERKPLRLKASLASSVRHAPGRREYQRGMFEVSDGGKITVSPTGDQGSNRLGSFRSANCLIELSEDEADLSLGTPIWIYPLEPELRRFV